MILQVSKQIQIPNKIGVLRHIRRAIRIFLQNDVSETWKYRIVLALDEAISNIIEHGYPIQRNSRIFLGLNKDNVGFTFILTDDAIEFQPLKKDYCDYRPKSMDVSHGFGLLIIHSLMEVQYLPREGGGNILILKKAYSEMY